MREREIVLFFISEQQNAHTTTGGVLSGENLGKWVFLDFLQRTRKRLWRGMADSLAPNPRKALTEGKSYYGTNGLPFN